MLIECQVNCIFKENSQEEEIQGFFIDDMLSPHFLIKCNLVNPHIEACKQINPRGQHKEPKKQRKKEEEGKGKGKGKGKEKQCVASN